MAGRRNPSAARRPPCRRYATAAALKVAKKAPQGSVVLAMLPDTGERYLSTFLFEGVSEASDEI